MTIILNRYDIYKSKKLLTVSQTYLCMLAIIGQIRILLVATAFVVLGTMGFPIAQAHPAEIMSTCTTLHVIAATVFLNANLALGAVLQA